MARMLPREAENGVGMKGLPGEESVKRFERSNGLDTALYKTIGPYLYLFFWKSSAAGFRIAATIDMGPVPRTDS